MKLSKEEILYIKAIGAIAKVDAVDCMIEAQTVSFLVRAGQMGAAIGRNGGTIKRFKEKTGKNMEVFEYGKEAEGFVRKAFKGVEIGRVEVADAGKKKVMSLILDSTNKRKILQNLGRLSRVRKIAEKTYGVEEIKIR